MKDGTNLAWFSLIQVIGFTFSDQDIWTVGVKASFENTHADCSVHTLHNQYH